MKIISSICIGLLCVIGVYSQESVAQPFVPQVKATFAFCQSGTGAMGNGCCAQDGEKFKKDAEMPAPGMYFVGTSSPVVYQLTHRHLRHALVSASSEAMRQGKTAEQFCGEIRTFPDEVIVSIPLADQFGAYPRKDLNI